MSTFSTKVARQLVHSEEEVNWNDVIYNGEYLGNNIHSSLEFFEVKDIIKTWYNEKDKYNYTDPMDDQSKQTREFSQWVWKDTKEIRIGLNQSNTGKFYFVVRYFPCGNVLGNFERNVIKPK